MSEYTVSGTFDTKKIDELNPLSKINGKHLMLIDDGEVTYSVTVDTLLGYIRDQINASIESGGIPGGGGQGTTIHVIPKGAPNLPAESRETGHYYIHVMDTVEAQLSSGLPRIIKVSPNMQLKLISG